MKFLGHLLRHDCLEKEVFLGKIERRRARGRQRVKYAESLIKDIPGEMTVIRVLRLVQKRKMWRLKVTHVNQDTALWQGKPTHSLLIRKGIVG